MPDDELDDEEDELEELLDELDEELDDELEEELDDELDDELDEQLQPGPKAPSGSQALESAKRLTTAQVPAGIINPGPLQSSPSPSTVARLLRIVPSGS